MGTHHPDGGYSADVKLWLEHEDGRRLALRSVGARPEWMTICALAAVNGDYWPATSLKYPFRGTICVSVDGDVGRSTWTFIGTSDGCGLCIAPPAWQTSEFRVSHMDHVGSYGKWPTHYKKFYVSASEGGYLHADGEVRFSICVTTADGTDNWTGIFETRKDAEKAIALHRTKRMQSLVEAASKITQEKTSETDTEGNHV